MSESAKAQQRPGATPIKNPLLSASVTGLTFDDFPNKPLLLPAAPPIVHSPPVPPPTTAAAAAAAVAPAALLGREHKSLVTVGSSSLDTETLDEINLNSSTEDSVAASTSDANANPLLEQPPTTDSILSQAASSFSALPSVASNVLSSFSKRITAISSRETTPVYDQFASDANANYTVPQLDIQPTYTQQQVPVAPEPFYAPPPPGGNYFGSLPPTGLEGSQQPLPPLEPPKFYTPAEVTSLPTTAAVPPPTAAVGQNNFRLAAKKKLYAPIPGFSDHQKPTPTFDPTAVNSNILYDQAAAPTYPDPYAQTSYPPEDRRSTGGLFSKITNLAPTGVLQNITGLVQSAAGTITHTIKPDASYGSGGQQNYQTFDQQQPSNYYAEASQAPAVNYFAPPPAVGLEARTVYPNQVAANQAPPSADTFFNPQPFGNLPLPTGPPLQAVPTNPPQSAGITFFDPSKAASAPLIQPGNFPQAASQQNPSAPSPGVTSLQPSRPSSHPSRPPSQPGVTGFSAPQQAPVPLQPLQSAVSSNPLRPPSNPSRPPSQPGIPGILPQQHTQISGAVPLQTPFLPADPLSPQVGYFDPTQYLQSQSVQSVVQPPPPAAAVLPPSAAAAPPSSGGHTSFRLQKGTRLYKNPLTAAETAPVQVTPNQIAGPPAYAPPQPVFVAPLQGPPLSGLNFNSPQLFGAGTVSTHITPGSNIFVPTLEPQGSLSLFATTEPPKLEDQKANESIPLFSSSSTQQINAASDQSVPLFAAPASEEPVTQSAALFAPPTAVATAEEFKSNNLSEQSAALENLKPVEVEDLQNPDVNNPEHFFKPIEPVVETSPSHEQAIISSTNFFGSHEEPEFFKPIEPAVEEQKVSQDLPKTQEEPIPTIEEAIDKLTLTQEQHSVPALPESILPPATTTGIPAIPAVAHSVPPFSSPPTESKVLPPPSNQAGASANNPYRKGLATETSKPPSAAPPILANFFTPGPTTCAGDFNFFSSIPSAQTDFPQSTATDFFASQSSQPAQVAQNFFVGTAQVDNREPSCTAPGTQAINFFAGPIASEATASNIVPAEFSPPSGDCNKAVSQQSSSTAPYPCDTSIQQGTSNDCFPPLPSNIGIIPSAQESIEDFDKHQGDISFQGPPPPIGFENFGQQQNQTEELPPLPTTDVKLDQQQDATTDVLRDPQTPVETLDTNPLNTNPLIANPLVPENTTKQVTAAQIPAVRSNNNSNNFSNYFNHNSNSLPKILKDPSAFFDSFATQSAPTDSAPAAPQAANEDQRIQNFFNNPPPKDAYHVGDLNYDLVHSGLAIRNLQQRSLTPVSNLVEPPSSACSEFSNLTLDTSSVADTSLVKEEDSLKNDVVKEEPKLESAAVLAAVETAEVKHYEELPEEILKELRMANLIQGDKATATTPPASVAYKSVVKHWFYKRTVDGKQLWTPFSHYDSALLETSLTLEGDDKPSIVAVEGGRYDVNISERLKRSVYWESEPIEIRRCSWFYKAIDSKYIPYEESTAEVLEAEYKLAAESGVWHKTIILGMGEQVQFHGPTVIVHYQQQHNQDAWGGTTQTTTRPRVVKRDLDDFRIEQGESQKVDHLLFMVHGIGSACDLKLRSVEEVVDDFRSIAHQLVLSHYKNSADLGLVGRVEVLPISWHNHLHSLELGIDEKLRSITLESIPKLRNFTNDTLLDILFYTSPTFAQRIMNSIVMSLNDIYMKYRQRHPEFNGGVSLAGHSLGSLILFDLLCHQNPIKECEEKNLENPDQQFTSSSSEATAQGQVDSNQMESKQIGYTMGPAGAGQPFISYGQLVFQPKKFFALGSPVGMFVTIRGIDKLGLDFRLPTCPGFYNIFHPYDPVAYRIEALVNPDLSGCRPVLIPHHKGRKRMHLELKETMARVSTDLKNKFLDKFKNTFESVNIFGVNTKSKKEAEEMMEKEVEKVIEMQMQLECQDQPHPSKTQKTTQELLSPSEEHSTTPTQTLRSRTDSLSTVVSDDMVEIDLPLGKLNDSKRIDYVLQEAPLEFINEYIFALSSHVCYWDSEDTILFVMKEIYTGLGISPDSQVPQQTMTIERPSSRNSLSNS